MGIEEERSKSDVYYYNKLKNRTKSENQKY